jgi:membrane-bound lytic murein transglycosylase MltF
MRQSNATRIIGKVVALLRLVVTKSALRSLVLVGVTAVSAACRNTPSQPAKPANSSPPVVEKPSPQADALPPSDFETSLPAAVREAILNRFTGDFDKIIQRRVLRVGVSPSRTFYFVDRGVQRGVAYEYGRLMEDRINKKLRNRHIKVQVFFVPMPREKLLSALVDGKVDLAAGHLSITPERKTLVDFSDPTRTNVNQIIVTGPGSPPLKSLSDLSGQRIYVRNMSAYAGSLRKLNEKLTARHKPPVAIEYATENLEDDDLLEMVNAGLLPAVVVDNYLAKFWKKVFPNLVVHENLAVRAGGNLGIAVRKNNQKLRMALNRFMGKHGLGSAFGNDVVRRYLVDTTYVKNAASDAERRKFRAVVQLFRKYSDQYAMDFLLMAAQGYQESKLDQSAKSAVGAIGVMQLMPATGKEMNVGDISKVEPNIHAGVKYMHKILDDNFKDEPMDQLNRGLFTFASYNAGPGRIRQLRRLADQRGLDPNVWFGNVEEIAAERIGRETVTYVSNIYKYYVAYRLVVEENERRTATKEELRASERKQ